MCIKICQIHYSLIFSDPSNGVSCDEKQCVLDGLVCTLGQYSFTTNFASVEEWVLPLKLEAVGQVSNSVLTAFLFC